jgi:hypothetical protein
VPYADIAKKKGNKVYHLNIGQPDIKTPEVAMNSIKNLDIKVLEYSHSAGFESYRNKLSQYYKNHGLPIEVADIIIQKSDKKSVGILPKIEKSVVNEAPLASMRENAIGQQNFTAPSNLVEEKGAEKEEVIWVQVKIDPVVPVDEERPTVTENPIQKKRNLGQLLKKIKQVIKGNPGEWSEIKENFHLVANKYVQTEENIKQKIQFQ